MRIVLDAMGGDHAPREPVRGAVLAARAYGCTILLVGDEQAINAELARHNTRGLYLFPVHAPEVIGMDEPALQAVRRRPGSSHMVGLRLVREGKADAFVSAGHSGASMAGALLVLGRLPGIERPVLATVIPTLHHSVVLLDVGATTDCKPEYLVQFAQMGTIHARHTTGIERPRVALLANGEEPGKGNRLVQETHKLLRDSDLNFVGNAEPKDLLLHDVCDVLIADGFVGNLTLKTSEAVVSYGKHKLIHELKRQPLQRLLVGLLPTVLLTAWPGKERWRAVAGALLGSAGLVGAGLFPLLHLRKITDYRNQGGAPLLGVRGVTIIAHGKSDAVAIQNAIRQAQEAIEARTVAVIAAAVKAKSSEPMIRSG